MADIMEITELNFDDDNFGSSSSSSSFGGGLELLMNGKIKDSKKPTSDIDLNDLNNLENELNNLVDDIPTSSFKPKSDMFGSFEEKPSVRFSDSTLGQSTSQTENDSSSWDGYGKFNNIPMNPDKEVPLEPKMSKDDMLKEKFKYLRRLEALEKN